jgi:hypothetical protein
MGSMRFRFDGQPINETDTPAGVSIFTIPAKQCICEVFSVSRYIMCCKKMCLTCVF